MALPSVGERGGRRAALTVVVLPGLGLKWQRDQLCVESQPFFVLPAKELEAPATELAAPAEEESAPQESEGPAEELAGPAQE